MENETEFEQVDINSFFATSNSEQSSLLQPKIEEKVETNKNTFHIDVQNVRKSRTHVSVKRLIERY